MRTVKIGVIGCGAIAQVHHMPNLFDLPDLFDVTAVCDVSRGAAHYVAKKFHVPHAFTDYRELLAADVDAVLLCQSDPKTQAAVDAFDAGKHVFIEKPLCFSCQEVSRIIAAHEQAGTVGQVGYMKVFDPAHELALREVQQMANIRFVQVNHLHPDNDLHLRQFDVRRFTDVPQEAVVAAQAARKAAEWEAIGNVPAYVVTAFHLMAGSMIHDLYGLRTMLGVPSRVVSSDIWSNGQAVTITLEYPDGARCVASWVDLPTLWDFRETLEVYADDKRVLLRYPTGFSRGLLSSVTIQGVDAEGVTYRQEPAIDWESAFVREMRHFHSCIVDGTPCRTPVDAAKADIELIIDVVNNYRARAFGAVSERTERVGACPNPARSRSPMATETLEAGSCARASQVDTVRVMPEPLNPFPPSDADRHAIWDMLMRRDFEAFVAMDWSRVNDDFEQESFFAIDCRHHHDPREWRLTFPGLEAYRDAWLRQAEEFSSTEIVTMSRLEFLYHVSEIRDIEIVADRAVAHKRFSGSASATDGRQIDLHWQTLYHCRRIGGRWRIVGFTGYLPINA